MSTVAERVSSLATAQCSLEDVWNLLRGVADPEIPVISIVDLGIVRSVRMVRSQGEREDQLTITLTPTYSGCPATAVIASDVRRALEAAGVFDTRIETSLSPAWTTDWLTDTGRQRLAAYGIAPPGAARSERTATIDASALRRRARVEAVACPQCRSTSTELVSRFGSTPCKAQYRCRTCLEPFDYFKPH